MNSNGLELYAKIEDMLDFSEAINHLYSTFYREIDILQPKTLLDIGCGSGLFAKKLQDDGIEVLGVDLSAEMVTHAQQNGIPAICADIADLDGVYDVATATFDVLNYLDATALKRFMGAVSRLLRRGGYFLADVNTLYGFSNIAPGCISVEDERRFAVIEADFERPILTTAIHLFSAENGIYRRQSGEIRQYYHTKGQLAQCSDLSVEGVRDICLYGDRADKQLYLFRKR